MLTPCKPCVSSNHVCEQCLFGYRSYEENHERMKKLIIETLQNKDPWNGYLAERYMEYHPDTWRKDVGDYSLEDIDKKEYKMKDTLLVSIVNDILIVATKGEGEIPQIVNAFQGEEAKALYNKLVTVSKKEQ